MIRLDIWFHRLATMPLIRHYLELVRFSHTIFALPFAFLSAALAWKDEAFRWRDAVGILLCMVFARSFAMAFNRLVDRSIDARNPRTAGRHLPAGTLNAAGVAIFSAANAALFVAATLLFANSWPLILAGPVLLFIAGYSFAKRFTTLVHFWLGTALMLAPVAAWIAIRGMTDMTAPLLLGAAVMFWVSGFDILYACQDVDFDRKEGLHSLPARFGTRRSLRMSAICHAFMVGLLAGLYFVSPHLDMIYLAGLGAVAALLVYEHWLVRPEDLTRVNIAFFKVNGVISAGLLGVVVLQLVLR